MAAQVVHCATQGWVTDHIGSGEKCLPSVQCIPVQPSATALSERREYFPDEHALPFNKHLVNIYYAWDTVLGSGNTSEKMYLHLHGAYTLAEWRRETDNEQKSNKVHTLSHGDKC